MKITNHAVLIALLTALAVSISGCGIGVGIGGIGFGIGIGSPPAEAFEEEYAGGVQIDDARVKIVVDDDFSYHGTREVRTTVLQPAGLHYAQRATIDYEPASQTVELAEAYVIRPDGARVPVSAENVFTRPSVASQRSPEFMSRRTMTVVFPQLRVDSQTYVKWRFKHRGSSPFGFNQVFRAPLVVAVKSATIELDTPESSPIRCAGMNGVEVDTTVRGGRRVTIAKLAGYTGQAPEVAMVSAEDVVPTFIASSVDRWETIGAKLHDAWKDRIVVTDEIAARAKEIAGSLEGVEAARAIYRWVCANVQYVRVYIGSGDSWVPHPAAEVLRNGYGDCKDQYVLLASLLQARGITCEPVLARWNRSFRTLPLPTPLAFDHCLAYLPEFDLYANPTNRYEQLGELGQTLSDKFVVIGTPEGRTARTPAASSKANEYVCNHQVRIDATGKVRGTSRIVLKGRPASRYRSIVAEAARSDAVANDLLWRSPTGGVGSIETTDPTDLDKPFVCEGTWTSERGLEMGDRVYFATPTGVDFFTSDVARRFITPAGRKFPIIIAAVHVALRYEIASTLR